jgi:nucleotide-binding universal stress UspA family protein
LIQLNVLLHRLSQHSDGACRIMESEIMNFRTILAAVSGGGASAGVMEIGCRLARRFNSHIEFFHVRFDPRDMALVAADGFGTPLAGELVETAVRDAAATAARARGLFEATVKRHALLLREEPPPIGIDAALLTQPSACWREDIGDSPVKASDRARLFDLMILGRSGRVVDEPHSDAIEEALLTAGRPVLVAPADPPPTLGERIAIAWNGTPECAKALSASRPFLLRAREIHVLSLGQTGAADLAKHLAWYGIHAIADDVHPVKGVGAGELLLAAAHEHAADLLVMGGYGHAPWRQMLFGGATREVLRTSLLPLLLSH